MTTDPIRPLTDALTQLQNNNAGALTHRYNHQRVSLNLPYDNDNTPDASIWQFWYTGDSDPEDAIRDAVRQLVRAIRDHNDNQDNDTLWEEPPSFGHAIEVLCGSEDTGIDSAVLDAALADNGLEPIEEGDGCHYVFIPWDEQPTDD